MTSWTSHNTAWLPLPASVEAPVDLYTGRRLSVKGGRMLVRVGPRAGRVVVELSGALRNYLVECATTLAGTAKQLAEMSEQQRSQLPPLAAGDWKSAAASATTWADRLSRLAETEVGGRVSDRSKTIDPLTQIDKWCQTLPSADHPILRAFRFADEHACRAAGLMTGP